MGLLPLLQRTIILCCRFSPPRTPDSWKVPASVYRLGKDDGKTFEKSPAAESSLLDNLSFKPRRVKPCFSVQSRSQMKVSNKCHQRNFRALPAFRIRISARRICQSTAARKMRYAFPHPYERGGDMKLVIIASLVMVLATIALAQSKTPSRATSNPVVSTVRQMEERQSKNLIGAAGEMPEIGRA